MGRDLVPKGDIEGLCLEHISKSYGGSQVLNDFNLHVPVGEVCCLLGPSGCGKTTALRITTGLLDPDEGRVLLGGRDISVLPPGKRNIGMVFQNYALFPHLDVAENVAYGLRRRGVGKPEIREKVARVLELVRLDGYERRRVSEISGGQQQRVALARALVIEPDLLLLDEPLSNLDARLRSDLREDLRSVFEELKVTTVFVTHDQEEAMGIADRIVVMNSGKIEQQGSPEDLYRAPMTPFVADFLGRLNRFSLPGGGKVAVRPETIRIVKPEEGIVSGKVLKNTFMGATVRCSVALESGETVIVDGPPNGMDITPGDLVGLVFSSRSVIQSFQ